MQPTNAQATFYLQFVWCAYEMFYADPTNPTPSTPADWPSGYRIINYMTSSDPLTGDRVFFGFIALPESPADGPGILAIRGTADVYEWFGDFDATPVPFATFPNAQVAQGFYDFVEAIEWQQPAGGASTSPEALLADAASWPEGFVITGHSLGGSMATLLMAKWRGTIGSLMLTLVTAAAPAVGDGAFRQGFEACAAGACWRYVNDFDVIAKAYDLIYDQTPTGLSFFSLDIEPTPRCEHSLSTYFYLLSPDGTACDGDCCIVDDEAKRRLSALAEQKRPLRVAAMSGGAAAAASVAAGPVTSPPA